MKKLTYWLCFAGGLIAWFLPFLLLPNAWIFFIGPFMGIFSCVQIAIFGPFIFARIQALCGKKGALGWINGSLVSVVIGTILCFTIGLSFVPV